jgi:iron complex outermembrane receptor protein
MNKSSNLRKNLLLFTACTVAAGLTPRLAALAQTAPAAPAPVVVPGDGAATNLNEYQIQQVQIRYKKLLLKEKDIPNAVSVIGPKAIASENPVLGSIQTLLNKTPSVVAYTQGPGQSAPTLAIRGIRNDELAETLDGVPINDLLAGSGDYISNNVGSAVTLNEIDGVTIYPGVAPPDKQGFGTVGGTIAYTTKQPTDDRYFELEGGIASFNTQHVGFTINTGKLGSGPDAPKMLMLYDQSQTSGFVSNTPAQYHDFMFDVLKPYNNGLSKVSFTVIYNQAKGTIQSTPTPTALIDAYGYNYNFPKELGFYNQTGQFLTTILNDETYINQYMIASGSLFYLHSSGSVDSYAAPITVTGGYPYTPNVQAPFNFFGPIGPSAAHYLGQPFYSPGYFTYDPLIFAPGSDPTAPDNYATGETSEYSTTHNNTFGITPKLDIFLPHNTITIGGLLAKESGVGGSSVDSEYIYGGTDAQFNRINGYNSFILGGGQQRTVYVAYVQDKIDLFDNHLHILPGARVNAAYSSNIQQLGDGIYNPAKLQNFTKDGEPYLGLAYDLPYHITAYGSYGKGSLFSPVSDYSVGTGSTGLAGGTSAPTPEIVHLYEAGVRYDTPRLYLNVDYFYQKVNDAFSFYTDYLTNAQFYSNTGAYLVRGVEMSGDFRVTPTISVYANGSYNNTDYLNDYFAFTTIQQDQFGYAHHGTPFSNVPDWNSNMGIDYDSGPYSARLSGQYTGREYTTYDEVAYPLATNPLNGATVTNTEILNPANYIVNLLLSYKIPVNRGTLKDVTLSLNLQNILDEHYYTYTYSSDTANQGIYSINPPFNSALIGPPRSITFDVTAKF